MKPVFDKFRYPAAMIDMGMRQDKGLKRCGREAPVLQVAFFNLFPTLEKTAIDQDLSSLLIFDEITGSRYRSGGSQTGYLNHNSLLFTTGSSWLQSAWRGFLRHLYFAHSHIPCQQQSHTCTLINRVCTVPAHPSPSSDSTWGHYRSNSAVMMV